MRDLRSRPVYRTEKSLLLAPSLYGARKQDTIRGGNHKRLYFVAAAYSLATTMVDIHLGAGAGLIPNGRVELFYLLTAVSIPGIYAGGLLLRKTLS
jgi:hypothetical protein